jgi:hypothetical protein
MAQRLQSERSTEAPMDFQFTSRPSVDMIPVWKTPATPLKREYPFSPIGALNGNRFNHLQAHTQT